MSLGHDGEYLGRGSGEAQGEAGWAPSVQHLPTDGIGSLLYVMEEGETGEMAMIGEDGVVGVALFMGGQSTPSRAVVQSAGHALRIKSVIVRREFDRAGPLQLLLLRYVQVMIAQMGQTAVCNRHHKLEQQLCRWLLMSMDRLPGNELAMTQELIANMLGVRREGVTEAAGRLQNAGIITYRRGRIKVLDRTRLEGVSCECYQVVRDEMDRLLPWEAAAAVAGRRA